MIIQFTGTIKSTLRNLRSISAKVLFISATRRWLLCLDSSSLGYNKFVSHSIMIITSFSNNLSFIDIYMNNRLNKKISNHKTRLQNKRSRNISLINHIFMCNCIKMFTVLLFLSPKDMDGTKFVKWCQEEYKVSAIPGSRFSSTNEAKNFLRLSIGFHTEEVLEAASRTLCQALLKYIRSQMDREINAE